MSLPVENNQEQAIQTPNDKEYNFGQIRRQLEQERHARLQAEQRLTDLEATRHAPKDEEEESNEPYIDKRTLKKAFSQFGQDFEKKVEAKAGAMARSMIEQERQANFLKANPDYNQIMSPEMIEKFAQKHAELAEPMLEMPEGFARQKLLYQNIKALGLHKPPEPARPIQEKIDANRKSPYYQPSMLSGAPPHAQVGDFSDTGQKNAWDNMQKLIKGRRGLS